MFDIAKDRYAVYKAGDHVRMLTGWGDPAGVVGTVTKAAKGFWVVMAMDAPYAGSFTMHPLWVRPVKS